MFPLKSLENHYAKQQMREHRKAQQDFAEGDVEGYHKHEHRAHRAARHASAVRSLGGSGDKENRSGSNSSMNAFGSGYGLGLNAGVPPLQPIAPPTQPGMYVVPQLQVIPLAPIIIDEIQSAPSMTSLTSSPFGQNVLLGGPMDFPAATSFSSDQGCGLPPMTYSRSFDAPLDANAAFTSAAVQDLQTKLIDREARLIEIEQQRSFDQAELEKLRAQIDQLRGQLSDETNRNATAFGSRQLEPLSPSSGISSSDSEDDGLGDNDGSIRRPLNLNTHIFPLAEEGSFPLPNSMSLTESVAQYPLDSINGMPDGGFDAAAQPGVPYPRNLPPRVRTWEIPFVPSVELPVSSVAPAMLNLFGRQVDDSGSQPPLSGGNSQQLMSAQPQDPQYLVSPTGEFFDGLEVNSRDLIVEPNSAGPYQRLLLSNQDEDANQNVGEGNAIAASSSTLDSDPFAPPPIDIEISRAESEQYEGDHHHRPHQHAHRHVVHQHHLKHLNQPQGHHTSTSSAHHPTKRPTHTATAKPAGVNKGDSTAPRMEKLARKENSAESEILHYKTTKTPHNTVNSSTSGASAPLRTL